MGFSGVGSISHRHDSLMSFYHGGIDDLGRIGWRYNYAKMPMPCTAIFHVCEIDKFQMKNCDIFFIFPQNIDRGYTLELPQ